MHKILVFLLALAPCSAAAAPLVAITPLQQKLLGIRTAPVRLAAAQESISVLGRIAPAPSSRIPVVAPFAGTVKSLLRLEGASVRKGEALAAISSAEMRAGEARQQSAAARYRSAKAAADRARQLVAEGIAPASRAEEANAEAAAAAAEMAASHKLMAQVSGSEASGYRLLAPEDGRIASIHVSMGEQITAMQPVLEIDTGEELWAEGALPASAIGKVAVGDSVIIEDMPQAQGTVMAAGSSIDPRSRSATLRAKLTGASALVPGATVRLSVMRRAGTGSFTVPRISIVEMKSGPVVFVVRKGGFEPAAVRVLGRGPSDATITGPLAVGDTVAVTGLSELKAASPR